MKPIFEEERQFFLEKTGIELPTDCWRDGSKIYLDPYCDKFLYRFRVENKRISIIKDNTSLFKDYKQIKLIDVIEREKERVEEQFNCSVKWLKENIKPYLSEKIILAYSGGKDSDVLKCVVDCAEIPYLLNFANTSNESSDTYIHVKDVIKTVQNYNIMNPSEGFYPWIKRKNYFIPNVLVRNCCSTFKEGQLNKAFDIHKPLIQLVGVRRDESAKRAKYEKIMDDAFEVKLRGKNTQPKLWVKIAPIVDWVDLDIWVFLLSHNIEFHKAYRYGFERCGCLICPYQSDYADLLVERFYPYLWNRWVSNVLPKAYENMFVEKNFKWSLEEWVNGKWKTGTSKEQEIIMKKPTKESIKQLAELKGCTEDIAERFFKKTCCNCGKNLNPNEVGMNLKMFGRQMNEEKMICKKCMCQTFNWKPKEYDMKVRQFREGGCTLF